MQVDVRYKHIGIVFLPSTDKAQKKLNEKIFVRNFHEDEVVAQK